MNDFGEIRNFHSLIVIFVPDARIMLLTYCSVMILIFRSRLVIYCSNEVVYHIISSLMRPKRFIRLEVTIVFYLVFSCFCRIDCSIEQCIESWDSNICDVILSLPSSDCNLRTPSQECHLDSYYNTSTSHQECTYYSCGYQHGDSVQNSK